MTTLSIKFINDVWDMFDFNGTDYKNNFTFIRSYKQVYFKQNLIYNLQNILYIHFMTFFKSYFKLMMKWNYNFVFFMLFIIYLY